MITGYIEKKLKIAKYKLLKNRSYFGEIPGIPGVWANAKTLEACRNQLREVLEDWLVLQLYDRRKISGLEIRTTKIKNSQMLTYA